MRLQKLIARLSEGYAQFEFHTVFHSLHNFCTVDLSSLYLDILKDRLYISPARSSQRRAAQTALYKILEALVRLMAPILSFTAEEVWDLLPGVKKCAESVHLTLLPEQESQYLDEKLEDRWERILEVRGEVSRALEMARKEKLIGNSLEAGVVLYAPSKLQAFLRENEALLKDLFIVSQVAIVDAPPAGAYDSGTIEGLKVLIRRAEGKKCERCWVYDPKTGESAKYPAVCPRCHSALQTISGEEKA
jgi:isoleucyl-tRNA synthetase